MNTDTVPKNQADAMLIEKCQRGELLALNQLFERYSGQAQSYALRLTGHAEDAADVVSEGFIRIFRSIGRFQANALFSTWMYKILKNVFLDMMKKRRVNVVASLDQSQSIDGRSMVCQIVDPSENAIEAYVRLEHSEEIMSAIDLLPEKQRDMIRMYYIDDNNYMAVSSSLNTPVGTIKSRMHRAKANLKLIIENGRSLN